MDPFTPRPASECSNIYSECFSGNMFSIIASEISNAFLCIYLNKSRAEGPSFHILSGMGETSLARKNTLSAQRRTEKNRFLSLHLALVGISKWAHKRRGENEGTPTGQRGARYKQSKVYSPSLPNCFGEGLTRLKIRLCTNARKGVGSQMNKYTR